MSMGYSAAYADVIDENSIKKFVKKEMETFMEFFAESKCGDFEEFARNCQYDDWTDYDKDLIKAYKNLCKAFQKKTGLSLYLGYHDSENCGDGYDEVSESYWCVSGMYQLTPAGKKMKKYVGRKHFVQFG